MNRNLAHLSQKLTERSGGAFDPYSMFRTQPTYDNIGNYIAPIQFQRWGHDIGMWRNAIGVAEHPFYPNRAPMIRMYIDTVENLYIKALLERWKELTLLRDIYLYEIIGGKKVISDVATQALREQPWFCDYREYTLEALLYGYSLISMGHIENDTFPNVKSIRRENINPDGVDGAYLASMVYNLSGLKLQNDGLVEMCNHFIPTKSDRGVSACGYGLLYNLGWGEIHIRHIDEWNLDGLELNGQPIRVGTTSKVGKERKEFEKFLRYAASDSYILLDKGTDDKLELTSRSGGGTEWKSYENLSKRIKGACSQLMLGHEDAISSSAGKLGGQQTGDKDGNKISLVEAAMNAKQVTCGNFECRRINEITAPQLRKLGKYVGSSIIRDLFPKGMYYGLMNDVEEEAIRRKTDAHRIRVGEAAKAMNDAGYDVDIDELSLDYGMKLTAQIPERKLIEEKTTDATIHKPDQTSE